MTNFMADLFLEKCQVWVVADKVSYVKVTKRPDRRYDMVLFGVGFPEAGLVLESLSADDVGVVAGNLGIPSGAYFDDEGPGVASSSGQ